MTMADLGVLRWFVGKALKLPPRRAWRVSVERDLPITMRDGVVLLADRYFAHDLTSGPVVLMRSPYGRGSIFGMMAALLAERGLQVVAQSVRGTGGSGGDLDPMRQEQADGGDMLAWVRAQPWFSGQLLGFGTSYLGNALWAMASEAPDRIDGLALAMTLSNFRDEFLGFGGFTQAGMLAWTQTVRMLLTSNGGGQRLRRPNVHGLDHVHGRLPLGALDRAAFDETVSWWQDWVAHDDPEDPWWRAIDHSSAVTTVRAPVTMVAGWQDVFLPFQIRDFEARQAAGLPTWLTIGPWTHAAPGGMIEGVRQAVTLFSALREGRPPYPDRDKVRLYLQGAGVWRDYPSWPPPGATPLRFHLRAGGRLELSAPDGEEGSTRYVYDPADPTPAFHGPLVMGAAKLRDMTELGWRSDVVQFTSAPLDRDLDVIGQVKVDLSFRSDRAHTDVYACLCDVDRRGLPIQVVDGYRRLRPDRPTADASGVRHVSIDCWPTAYRFKRGHKLRLIIASGAHPRYARNLGTGEPLATGVRMVAAHQEVLYGAEYGSSVSLTRSP